MASSDRAWLALPCREHIIRIHPSSAGTSDHRIVTMWGLLIYNEVVLRLPSYLSHADHHLRYAGILRVSCPVTGACRNWPTEA